MTQHDRRFGELLQAMSEGRVRVRREQVWRAFRQAYPDLAGATNERQTLIDKLKSLEDAGVATLPKGKISWDRTASPPIPQWVELTANRRVKPKIAAHKMVSWRPELAFIADLDRVEHLEELLRINEFLKAGADRRPMVPMRERSVGLFGDEKRLDSLVKSSLFRTGRLSLEMLRCFSVAPPLVWERCSDPRDDASSILIIENHHTYWSFCHWNSSSGWYVAVVYGAGEALERSVAYISDILEATGAPAIEYFGDLDSGGVRIPYRASAKAVEMQLPPILPATKWYELLLEMAGNITIATTLRGKRLTQGELSWLPARIRQDAQAIMESGRRLPQELVGSEVLSRLSDHGLGVPASIAIESGTEHR